MQGEEGEEEESRSLFLMFVFHPHHVKKRDLKSLPEAESRDTDEASFISERQLGRRRRREQGVD